MTSGSSAAVPVIDVSPLFGDDLAAKLGVAKQIDAACRGSGFFYASNHGINVQNLVEVTNEFHRTMTDKEKYDLAIRAYNSSNMHTRNGYYMAIKDKKAVESYCYLNPSFTEDHPAIKAGMPMHEVNCWPDEGRHPGFRQFNEAYYRHMFDLSAALLRGFALALGKDEQFFEPHLTAQDTLSSVALIRYPYIEAYPPVKTAADGTLLSFEQHQDVSLITVLFQTPVPNLQVEVNDGGRRVWRNIEPNGDCFLINCGTYMPHITNGYYPAPLHRVTFINAERLSLPFFVNLGHASTIAPFHPHGASPADSTHNAPMSYGDYMHAGLRKLIITNGQT